MRWAQRQEPREWERRMRDGFLFRPRVMDGEWRWLERAEWEQTYTNMRWQDNHWIDAAQPEAVEGAKI